MEIVLISLATTIVSLFAVCCWVYVRIEQAKIQHGNPKRIQELEDELKRQAAIVNKLDTEGLEHVSQRADEIAGRLKDIAVGNLLGRR